MPMMTCDKVRKLLADYLDGTLDSNLIKEIDAHLENDAECRSIFNEASQIQNKLKNLETITPTENFNIKLRNKIILYNGGGLKEPLISKKGLSVGFSGAVLVAALYFYIFTDVGIQTNVNEAISPSSTIISSPINIVDQEKSDEQNNIVDQEETNVDSLKNAPEKIDNTRIHLTGKKD
jgi:hypothetical protein